MAGAIQTFLSLCPVLSFELSYCHGSYCLEIHAPNLRYIILWSSFETLSFINVPKLVDATFAFDSHRETYIDEFFSSLGSVENLDMCSSQYLYLVSGDGMFRPPVLCSIKHLCLTIRNLIHDISAAIWLIRNSPSIKTLLIKMMLNFFSIFKPHRTASHKTVPL